MNNLNHIAFIMDGNGRWGLKKKKVEITDILEGVKTVQKIVEASILLKYQLFHFMFFQQKIGKDLKQK